MNNTLINNAYVVGTGKQNLVLNTFGRVYVKVKDRYYELNFANNDRTNSSEEETNPDLIILESNDDLNSLEYPGDNKLIITLDGYFYVTQDGEYIEIKLKNTQDSLELDELIVNGQITINAPDGLPGLIISNNVLIENLNAQYLNGFESNEFAVKAINEIITGIWNFTNDIYFQRSISNSNTNPNDPTILDFENSTLTIDTINVRRKINYFEADSNKIDGINGHLWIANKFQISEIGEEIEDESYIISPVDIIYDMYDGETLPNDIDVTVWLNVYLTNYYDGAEEDENWVPEVRNLSLQSEIDNANAILAAVGSTEVVTDYLQVYYDFYHPLDIFNGRTFKYTIIQDGGTPQIDNIRINDIVEFKRIQNGSDEYYAKGIITSFEDGGIITIKFTSDSVPDYITESDIFVIIDNTIDIERMGGIHMNSEDNFPPFFDVIDNSNYAFQTYNEEDPEDPTEDDNDDERILVNNDNIKLRAGRLNSLAVDSIFGRMNNIGLFINGKVNSTLTTNNYNSILEFAKNNPCGIYIKNPIISFNGASQINNDGSGFLAGGKLHWTATELEIDGNIIVPDTIDGSKIIVNTIPSDRIISLDGVKIIDNTITSDKIISLNGSKLEDGTVTPEKLDTAYLPLSGGIMTGDVRFNSNVNIYFSDIGQYSLGWSDINNALTLSTGTTSLSGILINSSGNNQNVDVTTGTGLFTYNGIEVATIDDIPEIPEEKTKGYRGSITTGQSLETTVGSFIFGIMKHDTTNARSYIRSASGDITASWRRASIYDSASEGATGNVVTLNDTTNVLVDDTIYTNSQDNAIIYLSTDTELHRIETWISNGGLDVKIIVSTITTEELTPI